MFTSSNPELDEWPLTRLAAYLAAWLIVGLLLSAVFARLDLSWSEALALLLPLLFVYSFVCLSAWYVSRATPLNTSSLLRVLATSGLAAMVSGALWLALARLWIGILGTVPTIVSVSVAAA